MYNPPFATFWLEQGSSKNSRFGISEIQQQEIFIGPGVRQSVVGRRRLRREKTGWGGKYEAGQGQ